MLETVLTLVATYILVSIVVLVVATDNQRLSYPFVDQNEQRQSVLLVIAHPDDECMFFSPTIVTLHTMGYNVFVLCLSNGNFYGAGKVREKELVKSLACFGIPSHNVEIDRSGLFEDDPCVLWNLESVCKVIKQHSSSIVGLKHLIAFDQFGVSKHSNHCSIRKSLSLMLSDASLEEVTLHELITTNVLRKYIGLLDVPVSLLRWMLSEGGCCLISGHVGISTGLTAMMQHASQMTWFRYLYIVFSRYMTINELRVIRKSK